jgi:hypothetical protein
MIGQKFNFDEVFFRDLTVSVLDTLEGRLNWINRFSAGDVSVDVPIYYSLSGDERFLLDSFQDDIVSENRYVELNTDQIPRGHLTLSNFNIRSDEFRNPNVWLRAVVEDNVEVKKLLKQVRAIPITVNYDLSILLKTEIDVFKCAQEIMNTLWLYKFIYFEHNYMNIDAVMTIPDTETIEITREKNLKSDNTIKLAISLEVQTYYPAFTGAKFCKIETQCKTTAGSNIVKLGPMFVKNCSGGLSGRKVSSMQELKVGQQMIGPNIPSGSVITEINYGSFEVTLSKIINFDSETWISENSGSAVFSVQFLVEEAQPGTVIQPYRTRWFNNLQPMLIKNTSNTNNNSGNLG